MGRCVWKWDLALGENLYVYVGGFSLSSELASGWELNNQTKHFLGCCLCCETSTDDVDDARGNRHIRQGQGDK
jgi:hypothetical protein